MLRAKMTGIIEYTLKQKWKWAGQIARMKDSRSGGPTAAQSGNQGEGRNQRDDQVKDGTTT